MKNQKAHSCAGAGNCAEMRSGIFSDAGINGRNGNTRFILKGISRVTIARAVNQRSLLFCQFRIPVLILIHRITHSIYLRFIVLLVFHLLIITKKPQDFK